MSIQSPVFTFQQKHRLVTHHQPLRSTITATRTNTLHTSHYNKQSTKKHLTQSNFQLLFRPISNESLRTQTAINQSDIIHDFSSYKLPDINYDTITNNTVQLHKSNQPRFQLPNEYRTQQIWPVNKLTDIVSNMLPRDDYSVNEAIRLNSIGLGPAGFGVQSIQPSSMNTGPKHNNQFVTHWHKQQSAMLNSELPSSTLTRSALRESNPTEYKINQPNMKITYHTQHSLMITNELPSNVVTRDIVG